MTVLYSCAGGSPRRRESYIGREREGYVMRVSIVGKGCRYGPETTGVAFLVRFSTREGECEGAGGGGREAFSTSEGSLIYRQVKDIHVFIMFTVAGDGCGGPWDWPSKEVRRGPSAAEKVGSCSILGMLHGDTAANWLRQLDC
jgi:hypothetical protein